jgi:PAS domain S-box-containing protein
MDRLHGGPHTNAVASNHLAIPNELGLPLQSHGATGALFDASHFARGETDAIDWQLMFERQKRSFDLAMTASKMGTWRYTLADNYCVYDDNAQRLYGLTDARFLHDPENVKAKFHPDDLDLMWSRVARALDPGGDGRYDVEYRVKQRDGSWRWLSAWGLVEFDGDGPARQPVAIAGASRDIAERKQAEELQQLLLNELTHRIKNTLTIIQAVAAQTLKNAPDLPSAALALEQRIIAMARAHDLLTSDTWTGADLREIVTRTLDAFPPAQVQISGAATNISSRHTLALSLALHELATNASKYGSLSCARGSVSVHWHEQDGVLHLDWEERGGPTVLPPTHKGFGSRLIEQLLLRELGGEVRLDYDAAGLRCGITARLEE